MMYHPQTHIPLRPILEVLQIRIKSQDTIMSDSKDSTVTYTEAPPSPDYVPGPEEPEQAPPLPDFVPEPVYPEFMPPEDEVFPAEEQLLPAAVSPTADSLGYVSESDFEENPEEDLADYPADGGDDDDDEDESSDDDEDDDVDIEGDEMEEHPAPADSTAVALPAVDHALSAEETEPFETDESTTTPPPHPAYRVTARMSIRDEPPTPFWSKAEIARLLTIPSPLPSAPSPWSSPLPQIPSPPLSVSSPLRAEAPSISHLLPLPSPIILLCTRASVALMGVAAPSTYILASRSEAPPSGTPPLLPIPLLTPSPPLLLPSTNRRADVREACLPPRKRLCFAFGSRYEVGESLSAPTARPDGDFKRDYGFIAIMDDEIMRDPERDVGRRVTDLVTTVRQDTDEIYGRLDDAQTERQMVTSRVNMLFRDRRAHARTAWLMEIEARMSREA
ncbi:hypothetical protein Tco_1183183 [Tanacetum coccineum]